MLKERVEQVESMYKDMMSKNEASLREMYERKERYVYVYMYVYVYLYV